MYNFPYQMGAVGARVLGLVAGLLAVSCSHSTVPGVVGEHAVSASFREPSALPGGGVEAEAVARINAFRAGKGRPGFARHAGLDALAREHARDMMRRRHMSHDGFRSRAEEGTERYGLVSMAENVMWGSGYADSALAALIVNGWIDSKGHRKNLLAPNRAVGIGIVHGPDGTVWACQLSARGRD